MEQQHPDQLSLQAFLQWAERVSGDERFELVDGRPVALAKPTRRHNRLVTALQRRIDTHVSARGCESDASGATLANGRSPDIVVTCDERDLRETDDFVNERVIWFPRLIVEVLSPSTQDTDMGLKVDLYRAIPSVDEYLLLDSQRRWARLYRRNESDPETFVMLPDRIAGKIVLTSINLSFSLEEIYGDARIPVA
ncbi:MAG: Uma2 family endonuclease [Vulcanimicrobiaceae bacterium]